MITRKRIFKELSSAVLFVLSFFFVLLVRWAGYKDDENDSDQDKLSKKEITKVEDIPYHKYTLHGIKLPYQIAGIFHVINVRNNGISFFETVGRKYGPLTRIKLFTKEVFFVLEPHLIQKLLSSSDIRVLNKPRFFYDLIFIECFRKGLLASEVEIWQPHRRILNTSFNYKSLPTYLKTINKHTKNLISDFFTRESNDGSVEGEALSDLMYFHPIEIITEIVLGENTFSEEEREKFHYHFTKCKTMIVDKLMHPENLIPFIWWLNPKRKEFQGHIVEANKLVFKGIDTCKAKMKSEANASTVKGESQSFTSVAEEMLRCNASPNEIYDEIGTLLAAGHETTVTAMNLFLQHIAEHPKIQALCQKEIDALYSDKAVFDMEVTLDDLSNLKYLERCIYETMRLTSIVPLVFRQLSAPVQIDQFHFPKDIIFGFPIWAIHKDPENYPDPDKFDPDRFLPENVKGRHAYAFLPFSMGPRGCIGNKFAILEMKVILAWILRNFNVYTNDKLEDVKLLFDVTLKPERDYNVILKKRAKINRPTND